MWIVSKCFRLVPALISALAVGSDLAVAQKSDPATGVQHPPRHAQAPVHGVGPSLGDTVDFLRNFLSEPVLSVRPPFKVGSTISQETTITFVSLLDSDRIQIHVSFGKSTTGRDYENKPFSHFGFSHFIHTFDAALLSLGVAVESDLGSSQKYITLRCRNGVRCIEQIKVTSFDGLFLRRFRVGDDLFPVEASSAHQSFHSLQKPSSRAMARQELMTGAIFPHSTTKVVFAKFDDMEKRVDSLSTTRYFLSPSISDPERVVNAMRHYIRLKGGKPDTF